MDQTVTLTAKQIALLTEVVLHHHGEVSCDLNQGILSDYSANILNDIHDELWEILAVLKAASNA